MQNGFARMVVIAAYERIDTACEFFTDYVLDFRLSCQSAVSADMNHVQLI